MRKDSFWNVSKPAPDQADVGWRNLKGLFEKQPLQIKRERCAKSDEDCADEGESQIIHESPVDRLFMPDDVHWRIHPPRVEPFQH